MTSGLNEMDLSHFKSGSSRWSLRIFTPEYFLLKKLIVIRQKGNTIVSGVNPMQV